MGYYTGFRGDYYRGRGDFWKKAKKALKKVGKVLPVSAAMIPTGGGISSALGTMQTGLAAMPGGGGILSSIGGMLGEKFGIGAATGSALTALLTGQESQPGDSPYIPDIIEKPLESIGLNEMRRSKRRTMNAANVSALRRALRRVDSFRNLAKKSGAMPAVRRFPAQRASKCCK